ncbi:hypothetical protein EJ08DRAFT_480661 [Tothia fuscella]|uniref:Uncharacterized protein n=1 Tax=Tothia fuscella TaxID=1048955 RepID=A0A9P4NI55_9PEZI|nr:hypothetical protein EJ08DRAFT_480661 [Tothia fuscella]
MVSPSSLSSKPHLIISKMARNTERYRGSAQQESATETLDSYNIQAPSSTRLANTTPAKHASLLPLLEIRVSSGPDVQKHSTTTTNESALHQPRERRQSIEGLHYHENTEEDASIPDSKRHLENSASLRRKGNSHQQRAMSLVSIRGNTNNRITKFQTDNSHTALGNGIPFDHNLARVGDVIKADYEWTDRNGVVQVKNGVWLIWQIFDIDFSIDAMNITTRTNRGIGDISDPTEREKFVKARKSRIDFSSSIQVSSKAYVKVDELTHMSCHDVTGVLYTFCPDALSDVFYARERVVRKGVVEREARERRSASSRFPRRYQSSRGRARKPFTQRDLRTPASRKQNTGYHVDRSSSGSKPEGKPEPRKQSRPTNDLTPISSSSLDTLKYNSGSKSPIVGSNGGEVIAPKPHVPGASKQNCTAQGDEQAQNQNTTTLLKSAESAVPTISTPEFTSSKLSSSPTPQSTSAKSEKVIPSNLTALANGLDIAGTKKSFQHADSWDNLLDE